MEHVYEYTFTHALRVCPGDYAVLCSEPVISPRANREKCMEMMFERFGTPMMYLANQAVLSLYSTGRHTGVVVDSGDSMTTCTAVYEGCVIPHVTQKRAIGGRHITQYLKMLLFERGYSFLDHGSSGMHHTISISPTRFICGAMV